MTLNSSPHQNSTFIYFMTPVSGKLLLKLCGGGFLIVLKAVSFRHYEHFRVEMPVNSELDSPRRVPGLPMKVPHAA